MQVYVKLVCLLQTSRNLGWIEAKAKNAVRSTYQSEYADALVGDSNITVDDWKYKWKAVEVGVDLVEIYPKLVAHLTTTYTRDEIMAKLDNAITGMKQAIRDELGSDSQTTVLSWHTHYSTSSADEDEA